jgi:hypothetical protein
LDRQFLTSRKQLCLLTFSLDFNPIFLYEKPIGSGDFLKPNRDVPGSGQESVRGFS